MLMVDDVAQGTLCVSDEVSRVIEDLQHTFGEGPCVDAYHEGQPVLTPDLAAPAAERWSSFTPAAIAAGARAIFGFPLRVGTTRLGALNLYRDSTGPLSADQHADASIMADVAARTVIDLQSHAPTGTLADQLEAGTSYRLVVHQASGMVSVQLGVPVTEALVRLRAHAFAHDQSLTELARAVVDRQVRFDDSAGPVN